MRRLLALLVALSVASPPAVAETLGRLFLTPERRAVLEQQRRAGILDHASAADERLRLDGAVMRSSGKRTVWINGRPQHDDAFASGPVQLRVGGSMDRVTRTQVDLIAPGAIRIDRPRRAEK